MDETFCVKCSKEKEITEIYTKVDKMEYQLESIYKELMGNGQPGLIKQWWKLEGSMATWKWIAGSGGGIAILAIVLTLVA